ncbi:MAG: UDP-N-acetylmuramoyl-L-alanyl-D-glutamate--2,6-diaminopimelate ligase, partial [Pygmaiobacter sp.]
MQLQELFRDIEYTGTLPRGDAVTVIRDSRKFKPGAVFLCSCGAQYDSHDFAKTAIEQGAALVVTQRPLGLAREVTVPDTVKAYALLCHNFFGRPAEKLRLVAVTGTNGKTTVTFLLKQILEKAGYRCGLIGTIRSEVDRLEIPAKFTTPEPWDIDALFSRMVDAGCTFALLEASSQALAQLRLYGLTFEVGAFTNLTQDHLDYHKTMEAYFAAKRSLFDQTKAAVVNLDDAYGRRLVSEIPAQKIMRYSTAQDEAEITAKNVELRAGGVRFELVGHEFIQRVQFPMPGSYSAHNALCAAAVALELGIAPPLVASALEASTGVEGRCEVLYSKKFTVICDFAHTADGITKVLSGLAPFVKGRLYVLFGCAGERDATKRHDMARAVLRYADEIILTSDNPRSENPYHILEDAESILRTGGKPYLVEVERRRAITKALALLE